jgi:hypothetical protein
MATKSKLKKGDWVSFHDRLWVIVTANGQMKRNPFGTPFIRSTRNGARELCDPFLGERIVRLGDIEGEVV